MVPALRRVPNPLWFTPAIAYGDPFGVRFDYIPCEVSSRHNGDSGRFMTGRSRTGLRSPSFATNVGGNGLGVGGRIRYLQVRCALDFLAYQPALTRNSGTYNTFWRLRLAFRHAHT